MTTAREATNGPQWPSSSNVSQGLSFRRKRPFGLAFPDDDKDRTSSSLPHSLVANAPNVHRTNTRHVFSRRKRLSVLYTWTLLWLLLESWNVASVEVKQKDAAADVPYPSFIFGIMVDGARHSFPVEWLMDFMKISHKIGLNTIHLTITNDQRFGLSMNDDSEDPNMYSSSDWKKLVEMSRSLTDGNNHSMTILPEVSLPIYATSWATARDLVNDTTDTSILANCPKFICNAGSAVPLNMFHPQMKNVLRRVFSRLIKVLDSPPLLHLGSNDVSLAEPCWMEAMELYKKHLEQHGYAFMNEEKPDPDYDLLEEVLTSVLIKELHYDPAQIIRQWNMDKEHSKAKDSTWLTGKLSQYKNHFLALKDSGIYLLQPNELNLATKVMDKMTGWELYQQTRLIMQQHVESGARFRGLLLSTEAMNATIMRQRNVVGRLLAISMAVPSNDTRPTAIPYVQYRNRQEFEETYLTTCQKLFPVDQQPEKKKDAVFPPSFCHLLGGTLRDNKNDINFDILPDGPFRNGYAKLWDEWKTDLCERLTEITEQYEMQLVSGPVVHSIHNMAFASYWQGLGETEDVPKQQDEPKSFEQPSLLHKHFGNMKVPLRGIRLDLVETPTKQPQIEAFMEHMASLGLNTLQLSMLNGFGTSLYLEDMTLLYHMVPTPRSSDPLTEVVLGNLVRTATKLGIQVIPEISITTDATGWYHAGFLLNCPQAFCENGCITNDVTRGSLLPILLETVRKLHNIFIKSSSYIHLGSDERNSSRACWEESGKHGNYDLFESRLEEMLMQKNWYNSSSIIRWENKEGAVSTNRLGLVTQYQHKLPPKANQDLPFFGSIAVSLESDPWETYRQTLEWAAVKPTGLIVKVSTKDLASKKLNLVAFAAGLSTSSPPMNREELSTFLSDTCNENPDWCPEQFSAKEKGKEPSRLSALCKSMTKAFPTSIRKMRKTALSFHAISDVPEYK